MKNKLLFGVVFFCFAINIYPQARLTTKQLNDSIVSVNKLLDSATVQLDSLQKSSNDKDTLVLKLTAEITTYKDSIDTIMTKVSKLKDSAKAKIDSVEAINLLLLTQLEKEKGERVRDKWVESKKVWAEKEKENEERTQNILMNKVFYLALYGGGGTGFADFDEDKKLKRFNGGFTASWQAGNVFALRSGIEWIRSTYTTKIPGYRNAGRYIEETQRNFLVPVAFEWAIRKKMISTQIYGGAYFKGNLDDAVPGLTAGVDFGIKAWQGYGFIGWQSGTGIVEYDRFHTLKIGYSFAVVTKKSYKEGINKKDARKKGGE